MREPAARRSAGVAVVEGPRLLAAALAAGLGVRDVFADARLAAPDAAAGPLLRDAIARGARLWWVRPGLLDGIGDARTSQGVVAVVARPAALETGRLDAAGAPLLLVADEMGDPGNAGTLVRSAAAFGAAGIVFGPGSVDAYNPKTLRASAGALFTVPILEATVEQATTAEILGALRRRGVRCLGADPSGEPAHRTDLTGPVALVLGHETRGLRPDLPLDGRVAVPMRPGVESLNVAMAGTVLVYEAARQRGFPA